MENMVYLAKVGDASLWLWLARGGGTAVLHGSTMAAFGMLIKSGRSERSSWLRIGAGVGAAWASVTVGAVVSYVTELSVEVDARLVLPAASVACTVKSKVPSARPIDAAVAAAVARNARRSRVSEPFRSVASAMVIPLGETAGGRTAGIRGPRACKSGSW